MSGAAVFLFVFFDPALKIFRRLRFTLRAKYLPSQCPDNCIEQ